MFFVKIITVFLPYLYRLDKQTTERFEKGLENSLGGEGYAAWLKYRENQKHKREIKMVEVNSHGDKKGEI